MKFAYIKGIVLSCKTSSRSLVYHGVLDSGIDETPKTLREFTVKGKDMVKPWAPEDKTRAQEEETPCEAACLILANKQDLPDAMSTKEVTVKCYNLL